VPGEQDERGVRGEQGQRGERGEQGGHGVPGEQGERAERGVRGGRGTRGVPGELGPGSAAPAGRAARSRPRPRGAKPPPQPRVVAEPPTVARRVAVTAPRRHRTGGYSARARAADLHAQPPLGQLYLRSLVRNQLRLALGVLAVLAAVLGGLPLAFALIPGLRTAELAGIRLPWLLLGVVAYPLLVGAASFHVHHAERVEGDFTDLLAGPDPDPDTPADPPPAPRTATPAEGRPGPPAPRGGAE
jgi:hypothetical protein